MQRPATDVATHAPRQRSSFVRSSTPPRRGFPLSVAIVLMVCALSGLAVGGFAHGLGSSGRAKAPTHAPTRPGASSSATSGAPTATSTIPSATLPSSAFTLTLAVTPRAASPGQTLAVTVTARNDADGAPVRGLSCTLRAPRDSAQPLVQTWPSPAITGSDGTATWQLTAPSTPGHYELEVYAQGQHGLYYMYDTSVVVSG